MADSPKIKIKEGSVKRESRRSRHWPTQQKCLRVCKIKNHERIQEKNVRNAKKEGQQKRATASSTTQHSQEEKDMAEILFNEGKIN